MKKKWRASKGLYLLLLRAENEIVFYTASGEARIGPGIYTYVGSACGPGGLAARLSRHLCGRRKRLHWHIDRLIESGLEPLLAIAIESERLCRARAEPLLAIVLSSSRAFRPVGTRIGSTDDQLATTHLYKCSLQGVLLCIAALIGAASSMPGTIQLIEPKNLCSELTVKE